MFRANDRDDDSGGKDDGRDRRGPQRSGIILILCMFVFAGSLLLLMYRAPRATSVAPATVPYGVPARAIEIVSVNLRVSGRNVRPAIDRMKQHGPRADLVFLQGATVDDAAKVAAAIEIPADASHQAYYPAQNLGGA